MDLVYPAEKAPVPIVYLPGLEAQDEIFIQETAALIVVQALLDELPDLRAWYRIWSLILIQRRAEVFRIRHRLGPFGLAHMVEYDARHARLQVTQQGGELWETAEFLGRYGHPHFCERGVDEVLRLFVTVGECRMALHPPCHLPAILLVNQLPGKLVALLDGPAKQFVAIPGIVTLALEETLGLLRTAVCQAGQGELSRIRWCGHVRMPGLTVHAMSSVRQVRNTIPLHRRAVRASPIRAFLPQGCIEVVMNCGLYLSV